MKCSEARRLIGDLLDETIGPDDKAELEEHCGTCRDCREILEDFRSIAGQAKGLTKFEPAETLWPRILSGVRTARLEPGRDRWLFGWARPRYVLAAALGLFVLVGGALLTLKPWKTGPNLRLRGGQDSFTMAKLEEAEKHYRLAIQALTEAVSSPKTSVDPQTAALFERDFRVIDEAIQACRNAVTENPSNVSARIYLLGAYKEKVEVLDRLIEVHQRSTAKKSVEGIL
jgi:hypothetical protein